MIVKGLSHRRIPFKRLFRYIVSDDNKAMGNEMRFFNNLKTYDPNEIITAFVENDEFRKRRVNGVKCYHDILSFHQDSSSYLKLHPEAVTDLVYEYINLRAPRGLVFGQVHQSKAHLHVHLMISGNEINSSKVLRLNNKSFKSVRQKLEQFQMKQYPELSASLVYGNEQKKNQSQSIDKRETIKRKLSEWVESCFQKANSSWDFHKKITENIETTLYERRGRPAGILYQGKRKFSFSTLGFSSNHSKILDDLDELQKNKKQDDFLQRKR